MGIGTGKEEMVVIAGEVGEAEEGKGKGGSGGMARGGDKRGKPRPGHGSGGGAAAAEGGYRRATSTNRTRTSVCERPVVAAMAAGVRWPPAAPCASSLLQLPPVFSSNIRPRRSGLLPRRSRHLVTHRRVAGRRTSSSPASPQRPPPTRRPASREEKSEREREEEGRERVMTWHTDIWGSR
uniref:Uncharacterized protein n=1 Tax=Oryza barthii TaxID=65489 RepID=A0A0D3ESZ6_9ORYZ